MDKNIATLLRKYQPTFNFHSDEKYYPIPMRYYLQSTYIYSKVDPSNIIHQSAADADFSVLQSDETTMAIKNEDVKYGMWNSDELICHVLDIPDKKRMFLQYVPFYGYNGPATIMGFIRFPHVDFGGSHQADLEDVIAEIDYNGNLIGYYLSQHGDQVFYTPDQLIQRKDGSYNVYVAHYTHANYPRPRAYKRLGGVTYDYCDDKGIVWKPSLFRIYDYGHRNFDMNTMGFSLYGGEFGNMRVNPLKKQSFWTNEPVKVIGNVT